jgi:HD-GYP domain-containing protein (c-di-GMP phosphodiesterase class II)
MKQHARRYAVLVLAQAACLALGLWLEDRFVAFAATAAAKPGGAVASATPPGGEDASRHPQQNADAPGEISLTQIRAIAFFWIAALQAGVAWLVLSSANDVAHRQQTKTENVSLKRYNDLLRTRDAVIFGLAKLAESRDPDTGNHLERIAIYSTRLASELRHNSCYRNQINSQFVQLIGISSSLHDIGKVGIADSILMKPGRFAEEERLVMQMHVAIGGKCVQDIETRLGQSNFLQMAREIALCHHERWDGKGYPEGLSEEEIPLAARIVAVADVYDALSTKRVYKDAIPHRQCVAMIRAEAGKQFDPAVVEAFLAIESEFDAVVKRCMEQRVANAVGEIAAAGADTDRSVGKRMDDDLTMAMQLLDQWAADSPDDAVSPRERKATSDTKTNDCCGEGLENEAEAVNSFQFKGEHANVT